MRAPAADLLPIFRVVAHLEAVSWTGLLLGMLFERVLTQYAVLGDRLVAGFGSVHGLLVLAFAGLGIALAVARRWPPRMYVLGFLAALLPFATVVFDRWAMRHGHYADRRGEGASDRAARAR
jgi:integral membrane protein